VKKILVVENRKAQLVDAKKFESEATLQTYLEQFPSLLPVWEVDEDAPPLLTIGREVGVPSGAVDLLFTDANGLLTVVETKLAKNPQVRREVIGQVIEYASFLSTWDADDVERQANEYLRSDRAPEAHRGLDLYEALSKASPEPVPEDVFRERVEDNLKGGRIRLVIAVDEVVEPLRSTVTFLNSFSPFDILVLQLVDFEESGSRHIFIPSLFGYSRRVPTTPTRGHKWDEDRFIAHLRATSDAETVSYTLEIYERFKEWTDEPLWGSGKTYGSFNLVLLTGATRVNLASIMSRGDLGVNFGWMQSKIPEEIIRSLAEELKNIDGLALPADAVKKWPCIPRAVLRDPLRLEQVMNAIHRAAGAIRAL
jgi:hypothetical protein